MPTRIIKHSRRIGAAPSLATHWHPRSRKHVLHTSDGTADRPCESARPANAAPTANGRAPARPYADMARPRTVALGRPTRPSIQRGSSFGGSARSDRLLWTSCAAKQMLIIEVDGAYHDYVDQRDRRRQRVSGIPRVYRAAIRKPGCTRRCRSGADGDREMDERTGWNAEWSRAVWPLIRPSATFSRREKEDVGLAPARINRASEHPFSPGRRWPKAG